MICPKCESENCSFHSSTHTTSGSFCDGCCGFLIFGPIGILCGLCRKDSTTKEFWVCNDCGCKFQKGLSKKSTNQTPTVIVEAEPILDETSSEVKAKFCSKCGKPLNAIGKCNFCGY